MRQRFATMGMLVLAAFSGAGFSHGLVESPPARNWFCGAVTKPDHVFFGEPEYPECETPFTQDFNAGYQFMSVLTHARGRSAVQPLPENVCGFNSESFNDGETIWDVPADWPTSTISAGRQEFLWNISWGPHFDDTEEFKYWITRPGFQFSSTQPLAWSDFEEAPFCTLGYDDRNPAGNPDVIALKNESRFRTFCNVPARSGRHVIYAEWGRNQFTLERFHSCMDVQFGAVNGSAPDARISGAPPGNLRGAGSLTLDGSGSTGDNLSYAWSVAAPNQQPYSLSGADQPQVALDYADLAAGQTVTVALTVSNADGSDRQELVLFHEPAVAAGWVDLGLLTNAPQTFNAGDRLSLRVVLSGGQDVYYPTIPVPLTAGSAGASQWPVALGAAVNGTPGALVAIGLLGGGDAVAPVSSGTDNRIYRRSDSSVTSAFLLIERRNANILFFDGFE